MKITVDFAKENADYLVLFVFSIYCFFTISAYGQMTSCVNLCDISQPAAIVNSIYNGEGVTADAYFKDTVSNYTFLQYAFFAYIAKITGLSPLLVVNYSGLMVLIISLIICILTLRLLQVGLFSRMFFIAAIAAYLAIQMTSSYFAQDGLYLALFLIIFCSLNYILKPNLKNALIAGIAGGFAGNMHLVIFAFVLPVILLLFALVWWKRRSLENTINGAIGILVMLVILSPFILLLHNEYHFKVLSPWISHAGNVVGNPIIFFLYEMQDVQITASIIFSIVIVLPVMSMIARDYRNIGNIPDTSIYLYLILTILILLSLNNIFLQPLLDLDLVPARFVYMYQAYLVFVSAISIDKIFISERKTKIALFLFIILCAYMVSIQVESKKAEMVSLQITEKSMGETAAWIRENTAPDSVFLGSMAITSAIAALTGRNVVFTHFDHANTYVDNDGRSADAAVIYFTSDAGLRRELLKKYEVEYLVIDSPNAGLFYTSVENREYLSRNGIVYAEVPFNYKNCYVRGYCNVNQIVVQEAPISDDLLSLCKTPVQMLIGGQYPVYICKLEY